MLKNVILRESSFWGNTSVIIIAGGYGFAMVSVLNSTPSVAIIHDIIVHQQWRRGGLGTKLLTDACEEAERMGASIVRLSVEPGSWQEGWYSRNGFEGTGAAVLDEHHCSIMEKEIKRSDA